MITTNEPVYKGREQAPNVYTHRGWHQGRPLRVHRSWELLLFSSKDEETEAQRVEVTSPSPTAGRRQSPPQKSLDLRRSKAHVFLIFNPPPSAG